MGCSPSCPPCQHLCRFAGHGECAHFLLFLKAFASSHALKIWSFCQKQLSKMQEVRGSSPSIDTCLVNPTWQSPLDVQSPSPVKHPLDLGLPWVWNSLTDSRGAMICGSLDSKACRLSFHLSDCHLSSLHHSPSVSHFGINSMGMGIEPSSSHPQGFL